MKIDIALMACDDTPDYLRYWPIVAPLWRALGIEPVLLKFGRISLQEGFWHVGAAPARRGIWTLPLSLFTHAGKLSEEKTVITTGIDNIPCSRRLVRYCEGLDDGYHVLLGDFYERRPRRSRPKGFRVPASYHVGRASDFRALFGVDHAGTVAELAARTDLKPWPKRKGVPKWGIDELWISERVKDSPLVSIEKTFDEYKYLRPCDFDKALTACLSALWEVRGPKKWSSQIGTVCDLAHESIQRGLE